ncbi:MAG: MazG family protein [Candidatus Acetothermia bacterium]|jgi:NTP pyrophosphatase (non-canonical NTP hydrolase)|nr:MazG family protein [Candidatus Acetothermia bacterium]
MSVRKPRAPDGAARALGELVQVIAHLRGPDGCPWDRAQTHRTLIPYLLEEAYEVAEALQAEASVELREELGDLLLQVLLHAQIEAEAGRFDIGDVADGLREKLVRRHPHVFGEGEAATPNEVRRRWEEIKQREGGHRLDPSKPALLAASKFVEVKEASGEPVPVGRHLRIPEAAPDPEAVVGEMLVEVAALARHWGCDPELALRKFLARSEGGHG